MGMARGKRGIPEVAGGVSGLGVVMRPETRRDGPVPKGPGQAEAWARAMPRACAPAWAKTLVQPSTHMQA